MRSLLIVVVAAVTTLGCGASQSQLRDMSSGEVGCPPDQIKVTDYESGLATHSWTATCQGRTHYCSLLAGGGAQAACKEAASAPGTPATGGCTVHAHCPAKELCQRGQCALPLPPTTTDGAG